MGVLRQRTTHPAPQKLKCDKGLSLGKSSACFALIWLRLTVGHPSFQGLSPCPLFMWDGLNAFKVSEEQPPFTTLLTSVTQERFPLGPVYMRQVGEEDGDQQS